MSSSSSSSISATPAAGLKAAHDRRKECVVKVKSVCIEDVPEELAKKHQLIIKIKDVLIG
jgi:hypothetical protein